ncbi:hypothetical protein Leryth_010438 [Lithospermum erythrorhizon]|nr:hypothetical protein Leryth_010438 [Lithospermum erythrorhizon]
MDKKVAIVGAGTSGLVACRYVLGKGYSPTVFEALDSVGGVWAETMETTTLQTPKVFYQFSDFPWPNSVTTLYPSKQEAVDYLHSYAVRFDLLGRIKFNSKVVSLRYEGGASEEEIQAWSFWGGTGEPFASKGKWRLTVEDTVSHSIKEENFDFVILCVGKFSGIPNIPEFPPGKGPESFKGTVIHSMECAKLGTEILKAKRPVIVGLGKTAIDMAMTCSATNGVENPCTLLYRSVHWNLPSDLPIPFGYLFLNRFSELLVHKPEEGFLLGFVATMFSPLGWAISKYVETKIAKASNLQKYEMVPKHNFLEDANSCSVSSLPQGFYERVDKGSIKLVKSQNFFFSHDGITTKDNAESLETDLVIMCTGFRGANKLKNIFDSSFFKKCIIGSDDSIARLYREMIHPRIPQLAVIGFAEAISNIQTAEMMSRWAAELLDGNIKLPNIKEMEKNILEWDKLLKPSSSNNKSYCVGAFNIWYMDRLCKDMKWNPKRKKGVFTDLFEPYGPLDYVQPEFINLKNTTE